MTNRVTAELIKFSMKNIYIDMPICLNVLIGLCLVRLYWHHSSIRVHSPVLSLPSV
eukprot:c54395_g1_i1 orf=109-276(+)